MVLDPIEIETLALERCRHPAIPVVYEWGRKNRLAWVVIEYVRDAVRALDLLPGSSRKEALTVIAATWSALRHLHARGVVHRDLTLSNVLWSRTADPATACPVRLIDFELALGHTEDLATTAFALLRLDPRHPGALSALLGACVRAARYQDACVFGMALLVLRPDRFDSVAALGATRSRVGVEGGKNPLSNLARPGPAQRATSKGRQRVVIQHASVTPLAVEPGVYDQLNLAFALLRSGDRHGADQLLGLHLERKDTMAKLAEVGMRLGINAPIHEWSAADTLVGSAMAEAVIAEAWADVVMWTSHLVDGLAARDAAIMWRRTAAWLVGSGRAVEAIAALAMADQASPGSVPDGEYDRLLAETKSNAWRHGE